MCLVICVCSSPTFTVEENEATYGKCVGLHGHNYVGKYKHD